MTQPHPAPIKDAVFLSERDSACFYDVRRNGVITLFDEFSNSHGEEEPLLTIPEADSWRWREGYLPILQSGDHTLFASGDELLVCDGKSCLAYPEKRPVSMEEFESAQARVSQFWKGWLAQGLILPAISPRVDEAWRSSLIQARCAFVGRHPSYGAQIYKRMAHDSFPPATLSMCETLLQYGHAQEALAVYLYYFRRFVRPDGSIDYYGVSVSEYGALLWLGAMFMKAMPASAKEIAENLLRLVRQTLELFDREDHIRATKHSGMAVGAPEADERRKVGIYYHNNFQLLRGLLEVAPRLREIGELEAACEIGKHATLLRKSLMRSFDEKKMELGGIPYSTDQTVFVQDIQTDRNAIYANYRYHLETLETALLSREDALALIEYRENHNGEYCGMTQFTGKDKRWAVDNWPIASYARGLLEYGEKERFHRLLQAQLNHNMSPDVYTAYEQETIEGDPRRAFAPFCVPVQLAFPRMLAWSYRYTTWAGETLSWGPPQF